MSSSLGCTLAKLTVASFDAIGTRKSPKGLNGTVVPINSGEFGSKIGSAAFKITIKARSGYLLSGLDVLELAVAPAGIVAPASIE